MLRFIILFGIIVALLVGGGIALLWHPRDAVLDRQEATTCAVNGIASRLKELLEADPSLAAYLTPRKQTMLHLAARSGNAQTIALVVNPQTAAAIDADGNTPIHLLAQYGNHENDAKFFAAGSALIDAGVAVNTANNQRITALHILAAQAEGRLAVWLIGKGAKPNPLDSDGRTPLDYAVLSGATVAAQVLKEHGATAGSAKPL